MISNRFLRLSTSVFLIMTIVSIVLPEYTPLQFLLLMILQGYIFFHADVFSGQAKGSSKLRTYRFLLFFVLCTSLSLYYLSSMIQDNSLRMDNGTFIVFMLMIVFGNLAPKIPFNRTLGLRLPWTLDNESTWRYAHRVLGYTSFPCAFLFLSAHLLDAQFLYLMSILCWFLIPCILSYQYHQKHNSQVNLSRRKSMIKYKEPVFYLRIIFLVCILASIALYPFLPNDLPMQFSSSGEANWTMPKIFGILIIPAIVLFLQAYYKQQNHLDFSKVSFLSILLLFDIGFLGFVAFIF